MLSDPECRQVRFDGKARKLADEKGLYLLIAANGSKYWRMDYRYLGRRKTIAFGTYPETGLKDARRKRDAARRMLDDGVDPGDARRTEKIARKIAAATSFEAVAREWHEKKAHEWVPKYAATVLTSMEQDLFPTIGRRPIAEITASEMLAVLRKVEARGALETLKRIRQRANDVFLYGIATGRAENNPVNGLHKALKSAPAKHRPALHPSDLRDFFLRLDVVRVSQLVKSAIKLQILTFLRPGELRGARWCEIDLDSATWIVPGERDRSRGLTGMKMGESHVVPLSSQAVDLLRELHKLTGRRDLVFPNRNDLTRPISDGTVNSALRAMGYAPNEATGHGFRSTATGALLEMGYRPEVIDRQLAHRERKQVFGAYSHQAEYMAERRKMMQQWADHLARTAIRPSTWPSGAR